MSRRLLSVLLCVAALMTLVGACGENNDFEDELRAAIRKTETQPRTFFYTDDIEGQKVAVRGAIEDDFRYRARVEVNGAPALDEIVSDDTLADRLLEPSLLPLFAAKTGGTQPDPPAVQALQSGMWVVDPSGAPSLVAGAKEERNVGDDFIIDALNTFRYVEQAIIDAPLPRVERFNPESISYRAKEDPFPRPKAGVKRYDITRSRVPRRSDSGGNQNVFGAAVFRKMSIYVRDGNVVEVREFIDIAARLEDIEKNFGIDLSKSRSVDEAVKEVVTGVNAVRKGQGLDLIRPRKMHARFSGFGKPTEVVLPTEGVVEGKLGFLLNRGKRSISEPTTPTTGQGGSQTGTTDDPAATGDGSPAPDATTPPPDPSASG